MKQYSVKVEKEIIVEFDENSEDFKKLWAGYKEHFSNDADFESFAGGIASIIARYGANEMIEGIGFVKLNGNNQRFYQKWKYEEQKGIVNVKVEVDMNRMVDFEIDVTPLDEE